LLFLAFANDARIKTQAGIIDESVAVNFANINSCLLARYYRFDCTFKIQWDMQVLSEMVHGPKRQNSQYLTRFEDCGGH